MGERQREIEKKAEGKEDEGERKGERRDRNIQVCVCSEYKCGRKARNRKLTFQGDTGRN